jgi:hypothetical protein
MKPVYITNWTTYKVGIIAQADEAVSEVHDLVSDHVGQGLKKKSIRISLLATIFSSPLM